MMSSISTPTRALPIASSWGHNQLDVQEFSFLWTLSNFSLRIGKARSSTFASSENSKNKFCLDLYPNNNGHVSIYLLLVASDMSHVYAKFKISIVSATKDKPTNAIGFEVGTRVFYVNTGKKEQHGRKEFILRDALLDERNGLMLDDTVTILCEVTTGNLDKAVIREQMAVKVPECDLGSDLAQLLNNKQFSDCTLTVGRREFKVYKGLLAARSPVFAAMFKHGMKEAQKDRVDVADIEPDVMQQLLCFIYTGTAPKLKQMANELLDAADKYQLDRLKAMCENVMYEGITPENACELLVLAHLHSANQLKMHAIRCINMHPKTVVASQGWKMLVKHQPELVTEVFQAKIN